MNNTKAFTLIELLVVVLIIGILASVAMPQYTLAVNKSRFANLRSMAQPYIKAMEAYHLANGEWSDNFDELSVDAPAGLTMVHTDSPHRSCAYNNDFFCCLRQKDASWATSVTCGRADYSFSYIYLLDTIEAVNPLKEKDLCAAKATNANADKLCKSLVGSTFIKTDSTNSPTGNQTGYNYYTIH
ncbi:type IV pilin protein [Candidatus Avelusimicrobium luingense]|uniref:type IV pilin protein n=1 Tax=Candidatus Avelusimicrobium luingense TaxID=3416211 RepID=UPI003D12204E